MHASPNPLLDEYFELWKEHGIDALERFSVPHLSFSKKEQVQIMFVGKAQEFEGEAGKLLAKVTEAMGLAPSDYMSLPFESLSQLKEMAEDVQPRFVISLGVTLPETFAAFTIHPMTHLLTNPEAKKETWNHLKLVISKLKSH